MVRQLLSSKSLTEYLLKVVLNLIHLIELQCGANRANEMPYLTRSAAWAPVYYTSPPGNKNASSFLLFFVCPQNSQALEAILIR